MPTLLRLVRILDRQIIRLRARFVLTTKGVVALALGLAALAAGAVALGGVGEDVVRRNGLETSDRGHLQWFVAHRTADIIKLARFATDLGSPAVVGLLAISAAVLLWLHGQRLIVALTPVLALGGAVVTATLAKGLIGRTRPPASVRLVNETEPSFPSGHTTDATALFLALGLILAVVVFRRPLARVLSVAIGAVAASAVGISRLFLGVHWPTDVLAGWALGGCIAIVAVLATVLSDRYTPADFGPRGNGHGWLHRLHAVLWVHRPHSPVQRSRPAFR